MDPRNALEQIALILERELANPYKARAFRKALTVLEKLSDDEIAAMIADGRMARTDGVGATTLAVIREAAAGQEPEYLTKLLDQTSKRVEPSVLRSQLRGDLHSHSDWSDGTTSIQKMVKAAAAARLEYVAVTDHSPRLTVANGLTAERLTTQLEIVDALDKASDIRILRGIEVDINLDGTLDQTPDMLNQLDVVVTSVHSKLRMNRDEMTTRMLRAIRNPYTNILGHCTGRLITGNRGKRPQSEFDAQKVFAECAKNNVAVEINSRPEREDPPLELIRLAVEEGCLFSIDSDAHAPGHYGFLDLGAARAEEAGVPSERIITTWPVTQLLNWTGAKR